MTTITEDYCDFETAKLLKEKGFDQNCATYYLDGQVWCHYHGEVIPKGKQIYAAPTQSTAMKWLREKHLLHISIDMMNGGRWKYEIDDISIPFDGGVLPKYYCEKTFSSYEEGINDAIKYCLAHLI